MTRAVRVAILSDTHGHLNPGVLAETRRCQHIVHAGDVCGAEVLRALAAGEARVLAVRGNNDTPARWGHGDAALLEGLPEEGRIELPGGSLVVVHGDRYGPARTRHARLRRHYAGARAVVYGHSHRHVLDLAGPPWVLNPGAAGRTRTFGGPSLILLEASTAGWSLELRQFPPSDAPARPRGRQRAWG
jgi:hypothetical protein